jgi:hypothetical protein
MRYPATAKIKKTTTVTIKPIFDMLYSGQFCALHRLDQQFQTRAWLRVPIEHLHGRSLNRKDDRLLN